MEPVAVAEKHPAPAMGWMRKLRELKSRLLARVSTRRVWRWTLRLGLLALIFPPLLQWFLAYIVGSDTRLLPPQLQGARSLLVVTAHPDDECLFFSPSILAVLNRNPQIKGSLVSMSTGNNDGIGELRKTELAGSCASLGIDATRCIALDRPELQDNPTVWWDTKLIGTIVADYVKKWEIDAIITFDSGGVSGHINHRAVSAAVSEYAATDPAAPAAYMVVTTKLLRKYTFLGDLPLTSLPFTWDILKAMFVPSLWDVQRKTKEDEGAAGLVANSWHRYRKTREAFGHHHSQYSWDRHLYLILSRYVWFNDLVRVPRKAES